jgi:hypothetical protein
MTSLGRRGWWAGRGGGFNLLFIELTGGMKQKGNFTLWQTGGGEGLAHRDACRAVVKDGSDWGN